MVRFMHDIFVLVFFTIILEISASTHWIVTENGKIQSQLDSPFHMRRPDDFLSLLEQEQRVNKIEQLYNEMILRKANIDDEWAGLESATELEARLYTTDSDCVQAGRPLTDVDLYTSVADDALSRKGLGELEKLVPKKIPSNTSDKPDCSQVLDLDFSMRTFPHLQVLSWNLTTDVEVLGGLKSLSEVTGQQIAAALQSNNKSWFLHNLAGLYWRTKGDAWRAIQCAKRAIYLSPRQYRDLVLLNLGSVVQQARCPAEAAIVLHAAVDHAPLVAASHFALANVYAILGDYNRSVACYDNVLKLLPQWSTATRNRFAVLCHHKLEQSLYQLHRSLQEVLGRLHEYHDIQEQWLKNQEQLMYHQAPLEVRLNGFHHEPLTALLSHRGQRCVPHVHEGNTVLSCESKVLSHHLQIDITMSLQMLLKNVEAQAEKISEQMSRRHVSPQRSDPVESDEGRVPEVEEATEDDEEGNLEMFVGTVESKLTIEEKIHTEHQSKDLTDLKLMIRSTRSVNEKMISLVESVTKRKNNANTMSAISQHCKATNLNLECLEDLNHWLVNNEDIKNQFEVLPAAKSLGLVKEGDWIQNTSSHVIGTLIFISIHLIQWTPAEIVSKDQLPVCSSVSRPPVDLSADNFRPMSVDPRLQAMLPTLLQDDSADLNDFTDHLSHALKDRLRQELSSSWLLDTVAALYWRSVANTHQMVSCIQTAVHKAPHEFKDIPLYHIARILLTLGHRREALVLGSLALKMSPGSFNANLVLFQTYLAMGQPENAMKYGKASLELHKQSHSGPFP